MQGKEQGHQITAMVGMQMGQQDAVDLIAATAGHCCGLEIPAFFVAIAASDARDIVPRLPAGVVKAPATVFGYALNTQATWSINSAEI